MQTAATDLQPRLTDTDWGLTAISGQNGLYCTLKKYVPIKKLRLTRKLQMLCWLKANQSHYNKILSVFNPYFVGKPFNMKDRKILVFPSNLLANKLTNYTTTNEQIVITKEG